MLKLKKLGAGVWGLFTRSDRQVVFIERRSSSEWVVREFESHHLRGRGRSMVVFLGEDAFQKAREWAEGFARERTRARRAAAHRTRSHRRPRVYAG